METKIPELREVLREIEFLRSAKYLHEWDQETNMPVNHKGHSFRSDTMAALEEMAHRKFTSTGFAIILLNARKLLKEGKLNREDQLIVRYTHKDFDRAVKLTPEFVVEMEKITGESHIAWITAREKSDFKLFAPHLKKVVDIKRKEAKLIGFKDSPYDPLLDEYEEEFTSRKLDKLFSEVKLFLIPFLAKIVERKKDYNNRNRIERLRAKIPIPRQREYVKKVCSQIGYDFDAGHLGESVHPMCASWHPTDARIDVRYDENRIFEEALYSGIHEAGHGMYYQGLPIKHWGTPLGKTASNGIDESQSRFWENIVGKSRPFWQYLHPITISMFPEFVGLTSEDFYTALNEVNTSLIRVDADEVTYNLHIILRYEIERDLIEGKIEAEDVPAAWNKKMKDYLGIDVPDDARGCLQDTHWSGGAFGYFPTYTIGNIYSAQIYEVIKESMCFDEKVREGNFKTILNWLRKNIHRHGSRYYPEELISRATGKPLNVKSFNKYLLQKYANIYNL